jgi:hypothetical protein
MDSESSAWLRRLKRYRRGRCTVSAWHRFGKERLATDSSFLKCLADYKDAVLVAGCQRSGTTMLARLITGSEGMVDYYFGVDDEHDAALLLQGRVEKPVEGRYCFQTTYLNECYLEYYKVDTPYKLIWVVRNPYSVVCSILYNWERFALNELFEACGRDLLEPLARRRYQLFGVNGLSRLERACYGYAGKTAQALELAEKLSVEQFRVVDYEHLVASKDKVLPKIYDFINLRYDTSYAARINTHSLDKANRLSKKQRKMIDRLCLPVCEQVTALSAHDRATGF